jgi:pyrroloquinoline quinone biosynthesis protein B
MRIRILGSAAGGRFPQWNCGCGNCLSVRGNVRDDPRGNPSSKSTINRSPDEFTAQFIGKPRTQAQLALSADGDSWFLAGASPDLAFQIESAPELHPRSLRDSPIAGVVLGSCDLDHVLGLLLLRELQPLRVYAAPSVLRILREENSMFGMLNRAEKQVEWSSMNSGAGFSLVTADGKDSGLRCEALYLSGRYPKYVKSSKNDLGGDEASAALFFESAGQRVAYIPAIDILTDALLEKIHNADLLLLDGTFWSDDELIRVQGSGETAHQMGHIPIQESLRLLKDIKVGRKMYIHLNNTNPILNEASTEYRAVCDAGWEVAEDNWQLEL